VHNEIFNVGDDEQNYRVREIAAAVGKAFDGCTVTFGRPSGDNRSYRTSFGKIRRHLPEFRCRWPAELGARQLRAIFERVGLTEENVFLQRVHLAGAVEASDRHKTNRCRFSTGVRSDSHREQDSRNDLLSDSRTQRKEWPDLITLCGAGNALSL
jgi:hypothetical protein